MIKNNESYSNSCIDAAIKSLKLDRVRDAVKDLRSVHDIVLENVPPSYCSDYLKVINLETNRLDAFSKQMVIRMDGQRYTSGKDHLEVKNFDAMVQSLRRAVDDLQIVCFEHNIYYIWKDLNQTINFLEVGTSGMYSFQESLYSKQNVKRDDKRKAEEKKEKKNKEEPTELINRKRYLALPDGENN
jgi:hypothetical protein